MFNGRVFCLLMAGIGLTACAQVPNYYNDRRVLPTEVLTRLQCELKQAATLPENANINLKLYSAGFTLTMTAESEISPNISGDWTIPYHLTDTFTGGTKAGVTDNVWREGSIDYFINLAKLDEFNCPPGIERAFQDDTQAAEVTYGSFGIANWFRRVASTWTTGIATPKGPMSYSVKFAVTTSGSVAPGFKIINFTGLLNLPAKSIDTHKLALTFAKNKPDPPPQQVCVTNMPGSKSCDKLEKEEAARLEKEQKEREKKAREKKSSDKRNDRTFMDLTTRRSRPQRAPDPGVPLGTQLQLQQQLDILRLRDALRP